MVSAFQGLCRIISILTPPPTHPCPPSLPQLQQLSRSARSRCRLQDFLSPHQMGLTLNHRAGNQEVIEEELMIVEQHYPNTGICSATNGLNAWLAGWLAGLLTAMTARAHLFPSSSPISTNHASPSPCESHKTSVTHKAAFKEMWAETEHKRKAQALRDVNVDLGSHIFRISFASRFLCCSRTCSRTDFVRVAHFGWLGNLKNILFFFFFPILFI